MKANRMLPPGHHAIVHARRSGAEYGAIVPGALVLLALLHLLGSINPATLPLSVPALQAGVAVLVALVLALVSVHAARRRHA